MISVCIFCFLCATHSPCSSHAAVSHGRMQDEASRSTFNPNDPPLVELDRLTAREKHKTDLGIYLSEKTISDKRNLKQYRKKRESPSDNYSDSKSNLLSDKYVKKLFHMFGDGTHVTLEGFQKLLKRIDLIEELSTQASLSSPPSFKNNETNDNSTVSVLFYVYVFACLLNRGYVDNKYSIQRKHGLLRQLKNNLVTFSNLFYFLE